MAVSLHKALRLAHGGERELPLADLADKSTAPVSSLGAQGAASLAK
jgi:hypothetical protein